MKHDMQTSRRNRSLKAIAPISNGIVKFIKQKGFCASGNGMMENLKQSVKRTFAKENGRAVIEIPETFSFLTDPDNALKTIEKLFSYGVDKSVSDIYIDHSRCTNLDICASTIMDVIVMSIKEYRKKRHQKLSFGGKLSSDTNVCEILSVSGILQHLETSLSGNKPRKGIKKLDLLIQGDSALIGTKIVEYFVECLSTQGFNLKIEGKTKISELVGEIVDNCKEHSQREEWFTLGHYSMAENAKYGECNLVFFNFGQTIAESFQDESSEPKIRDKVHKYARKILGSYKTDLNEDSLITVLALQSNISRKKQDGNDRGSGTVRLIEAFQRIGKRKDNDSVPLMTITSGRTHIKFDGRYEINRDKSNNQVIAFNKTNDLSKPPDPASVIELEHFFPGTIISMKFFIDREYLLSISKGVGKAS